MICRDDVGLALAKLGARTNQRDAPCFQDVHRRFSSFEIGSLSFTSSKHLGENVFRMNRILRPRAGEHMKKSTRTAQRSARGIIRCGEIQESRIKAALHPLGI